MAEAARIWMQWAPALGLLVAAALSAGSAQAADPPKTGSSIPLEAVALPVIVDGQLLNYVFVSVRLDLAPSADGAAVRAKSAFFRDDLVRAGHRTPYTRANDYTHMDEAKIKAEVLRIAPSIVGPGVVKAVVITKQMSQHMYSLPPQHRSAGPAIIP